MRLIQCTHPAEFRTLAQEHLVEREAENHLLIGTIAGLGESEEPSANRAEQEPLMLVIEHEQAVLGAALRTPPFPMIVTRMRNEACEFFASECLTRFPDLPGVLGPRETAEFFAAAWTNQTGRRTRLFREIRAYELERVSPVTGVSGCMADATSSHKQKLVQWANEFYEETGHAMPDLAKRFADRIVRNEIVLWKNKDVVAMAGFAGPTPNGIRINFVYTPPEHRERGYASALVAALSQKLLDSGRKFCFLNTDVANPTSNNIYQAIGYRPVCDHAEYTFEPKE